MNSEREIEGACMIFFRVCVISLFFISLNPACFQSPKTPRQKKSAIIQDTLVPFTSPGDSIITPEQFSAWFACNAGLDSLSIDFTNPVNSGKALPSDSTRLIFCKEQNRLCVQKGLKGGYIEYCWITDNLGSSKNKLMYDQLIQRNRKPFR